MVQVERDWSRGLLDFLKGANIPVSLHHTSGHASVKDLQRLATAISPDRARAHPFLRITPLRRQRSVLMPPGTKEL